MSEMIERVARAITILEGDDPDGNAGSLLNENEVWWQHRIPQARTAIEAMREPTDRMMVAAEDAVPALSSFADKDKSPSYIAYRAMIDAALHSEKVTA